MMNTVYITTSAAFTHATSMLLHPHPPLGHTIRQLHCIAPAKECRRQYGPKSIF